jgi:hypothetical protein
VSTALADPPAVAPEEQQAAGSNGGPPAPAPAGRESRARACSSCGAPLADGQDWCLQCGTGAPDSLRSRTPTWRSVAAVATAIAILVAGATAAAYAALSKSSAKAPAASTIARAAAPTATTPVSPASPFTPAPSGTATAKIGVPTTIKPAIQLPKAAKIPLTPATIAPTPTPKITPPNVPSGIGGSGSSPTASTPKSTAGSGGVVGEAHPQALLLDTNAASTYDPYGYAASNFGDPSLAIDGDSTTGWTALVEPSVAPKMAEGLVIDLNSARKLSAVALTTSTPGMTVQIYGSSAAALPGSITDPAWVALTPSFIEKKKHVRIALGASSATAAAAKNAYRFIALWISQAPASAVGTPQAPGHVVVDELELFKRKK